MKITHRMIIKEKIKKKKKRMMIRKLSIKILKMNSLNSKPIFN